MYQHASREIHITASDQTRISTCACQAAEQTAPIRREKRTRSKIHMTASDQRRKSPCKNPFTKQLVTSMACHDVRDFCCLRKSRDVCVCFCLCVSVTDAWVNRDVRFVSACQSRCACVPLSASESRCAAVSACHSRCACFCCLLVSRAVGVVCWLRARHHVRVLCLRVNHDVRLFLSVRGSVRQSS